MRRVNLPGVSYPGESVSLWYDTPGSQSPRRMRPRGVTKGPGSQQPFLNTFAQAFNGTVAKKINVDSYFTIKGLHFLSLQKTYRMNFCFYSWGMIPWGVSFFNTKIRISGQKLNQIQKYFNPLVSGPGWF